MFGRFVVLAIVGLPIVEIALFVVIGQAIGLWPTLLGVVLSAVAGGLILRWLGVSALRTLRGTLGRGELPARQMADTVLIGLAALLLILPGYLTSALGLLLLVPPVRAGLYRLAARHIRVVGAAPAPPADPRLVELDPDNWRER